MQRSDDGRARSPFPLARFVGKMTRKARNDGLATREPMNRNRTPRRAVPSGGLKIDFLDSNYVRQLRLIDAKAEHCAKAVVDYLRAIADRTTWGERAEVMPEDFDDFVSRLQRAWEQQRDKIAIERADDDEGARGRLLFGACSVLDIRLAGLDVPTHFVPGSYHALAEDLVVGWHPQFEDLLKWCKERDGAKEPDPTMARGAE